MSFEITKTNSQNKIYIIELEKMSESRRKLHKTVEKKSKQSRSKDGLNDPRYPSEGEEKGLFMVMPRANSSACRERLQEHALACPLANRQEI